EASAVSASATWDGEIACRHESSAARSRGSQAVGAAPEACCTLVEVVILRHRPSAWFRCDATDTRCGAHHMLHLTGHATHHLGTSAANGAKFLKPLARYASLNRYIELC